MPRPLMGIFPEAVYLIRAFYLLSASAIAVVRFIPTLRDRYLDYGARDTLSTDKSVPSNHASQTTHAGKPLFIKVLNHLAALKVPHNWFIHFYVLSSACSGFWLWQLGSDAHTSDKLHTTSVSPKASLTPPIKIGMCMLLLCFQSLRRLLECLIYTKASTSSMWIGHYAIGMAFYFVTNIAIWSEQAQDIQKHAALDLYNSVVQPPSWLEAGAFIAFFIASKIQHTCHAYLASLQKYTLPDQGLFRTIVAPHYTAECAIYLSLAILSAPAGQTFNLTMLAAFLFVVVNLGVTADGTKKWMMQKFGDRREEVRRRWRMVPGMW